MNPTKQQIKAYIAHHERKSRQTRDPAIHEFHCQRKDYWESKK
jgi:hypothetical protein